MTKVTTLYGLGNDAHYEANAWRNGQDRLNNQPERVLIGGSLEFS